MDPTLVIILAIPWLLIFLHVVVRRGFGVMLSWMFLAPAVTYLINMTPGVDLYQGGGAALKIEDSEFYYQQPTSITMQELIDPTRLLVILLFIILTLNVLLRRARWIPIDKTEKWMCIFSLLLFLNVVLWSGRIAFGLHVATDCFFIPFLAYALARRMVLSEFRFRQALRAIQYMGIFVIAICVVERLITPGMFYRLHGPFTSSNVLYVVVAVIFFTTLLDSKLPEPPFPTKTWFARARRRVLFLTCPVAVVLNLTRGDWIGFISALAIFFAFGHRLNRSRANMLTVGLLLVIIPLVAIAVELLVPADFMAGRIQNPDNWYGRVATWNAAIGVIQDAPILGVGLNNLTGLLGRADVRFGEYSNYSTTHNSYLTFFAELGVLGLALYLAIIWSTSRMAWNLIYKSKELQARWSGITVLAILVAYQLPSLFGNTLHIADLSHFYVYVVAGAIAGRYSLIPPVSSVPVKAWAYRRQGSQMQSMAGYDSGATRGLGR